MTDGVENTTTSTEANSMTGGPGTTFVERVFLATVLGFVVVTGIFGNCIVILAVTISKKLRTSINIFIVNLSIADLLASFNLIWIIVAFVSEDGWPLPDWLCVSCGFFLITCIGTSVFTLSCIAVNRVVFITTNITTYRNLFKHFKIAIALVLLWAIPLFLASIPLYTNFGKLGYSATYVTCLKVANHPTAVEYDLLLSFCLYPIPTVTITTSYFRIWIHVRKRVKALAEVTEKQNPTRVPTAAAKPSAPPNREGINEGNHSGSTANDPSPSIQLREKLTRRQMEVTKNMFYIVCIFYLCVTPYGLSLFCISCTRLTTYAAVILSFNSCINFFIYSFKHPDFKTVIRCIVLCRISKIPNRARIFRK